MPTPNDAPAPPPGEVACCAHLRVSYRTEPCNGRNVRGEVVPGLGVRGWWECDSGCGRRFGPEGLPAFSMPPSPLPASGRPPRSTSKRRNCETAAQESSP